MRITLVQPPPQARFGFIKVLRVEPLGLECVAAALLERGHEVEIVDLRLEAPAVLWRRLRERPPGAVGISCSFTSDVYSSLETARSVREALPGAPVFVGGHHASLVPGDFLFPGSPVEAVVIGEGETSGAELVDALDRGDDPGAVPGVMTTANRSVGFQRRPYSAVLDALPLPARHLTRCYHRRYHHGFSVPSSCVETSRGCPFDCNFCSIWVFYERRAQLFSPERIVRDLEQVRRLGGREVFFTDDLAFLNREPYEELGDRIAGAGFDMRYACQTRADLVVKYRDLFERWQRLGLDTIYLGIEKVDDDGLDAVRKRTRGGADTNLEAIDVLRRCGITPMTSLITDPEWGEADFDRLEEFVKVLDLPNPTFTILTPLPGTELWETLKSRLTTDDYSFFDVIHLVLPAKLGSRRFYERFARLYQLAEARTHLGWQALRALAQLALRGHAEIFGRIHSGVRDLKTPKCYLAYPGATRRPAFVPPDFGGLAWVDAGRSYLSRGL